MNIRLLGPPEIVKADGTIPTFTTAKSAGLFYYLVATRQRHTRSALAQLFWRDMSEQKARVNLSKALSDLRRNFGNHLEITTKGIYFSQEQEYWLDVAHFLAEHPPQQTSTSLQTLQQQVALYNGDFLQGFDVRNAPEFEDWVRTQLNVLRTLAVERLAVLATYYHNQGEIDAAIAGWRHLLTLERWHENAHVALMKLLAQTGKLHAALKQYEQYRTAVADELDVDPGAEVVALYHTLRANSVTAKSLEQQEIGTIVGSDALSAGKAVGSPTAVDPYPLRLIGRQSAWQQLVGAWQQTQPQGSHCVLLCGEAGIGKSYLADAFVAYLETMDVVIFRSRYYANDAYSTFSPMYDWMRDPRLQAVIQQLPNFVQQDIARFHPNLLEENPQLAPPEPAFLPYQKRRLFDSILAALDGLQSSIVLYIDDMHWMDPETATWLHHALNSAQRRNALLIIGTMRNESLASLSAWSQWLKARQHAQLISEIYLTRLDLEETASLLAVIGNPALNATVAASIFEISEGNPLFIVELARVGWPHRSGNGIPTQIEGVLAQRLRHVATDLTDLLQLAAVVGREFDYRLLFTCLDLPESQMVEQLEAVCRLELVQALSETIYRFSHGLLQEVIYSSLSAPRRHLFHQQIAHALMDSDTDATKDASIIGKHFEEARCWQDAIACYLRAGDADFQVAAFATAEVHYQAAQRLTRQLKNRSNIQRITAELLLKRGAIHSLIERFPQPKTVELYTEAHRLYLRNQDNRGTWLALRGLWETRLNCNQIDVAKELSEELLHLAQKIEVAELLFEASWTVGNTAFYQGRFAEAAHLFENCMTLHNDHGPFSRLTPTVFSTLLAIIIYQAFLALFHGNLTKSRALWRAADKLVTETAEVANTVYYESHRLLYAYFVRDIHYGSVAMDRALQAAHQSGLPMGIAVCSMLHFWFSALLGNHTQREIPAEALPIRDGASTLGASHHLALYAQVYIARNNFAKAQEVIALCTQNVERCGDIFMVSCLYHAEAQLLRAKGHTETEIHAAYQRAIAATQTQSVPYLELQIALDYAGYLVELGQSAVARDLLQGVLAQVEQVTDDYYVGASLRLLDRIGV